MLYSLFSHREDLDCNEARPAGGISKGRCNWNYFLHPFRILQIHLNQSTRQAVTSFPCGSVRGCDWLLGSSDRSRMLILGNPIFLISMMFEIWGSQQLALSMIWMSISSEFHLSTLHLQISTCSSWLFRSFRCHREQTQHGWWRRFAEVRFVAHSDSLISMTWQELMKFKRKDWDLSEVWLFCHAHPVAIYGCHMSLKPFAAGVCDLQGRTSRRLPW